MNIFGLEISRKSISIDTLIQRLEAVYATVSGISVTPENCMESPTVQAIVTGVSRAIAVRPVHIYRKRTEQTPSGPREVKEKEPKHPVALLLNKPNGWQTSNDYWLDATSRLLRYGNYFAFKGRPATGPIRSLIPLDPSGVTVEQDAEWNLNYKVIGSQGKQTEYPSSRIHHVRSAARNGFKGDSPVIDVREAIAFEIAAEKFGGQFFGAGTQPGVIFKYQDGFQGHRTMEERIKFLSEFEDRYRDRGRFKAMFLPKGIELGQTPEMPGNDSSQLVESRAHQRTVIAGAFGVPPHMVGDLSKGTYNNVEQQSLAFVQNCVLPYVRMFEAAMERDLLTDEDRNGGVIIRFNLEGALRADFKTRQEGLKIQREMGVISPNEWREVEGMNPREDGDEYFEQGPSGQGQPGAAAPGEESDDDAAS